MTDQDKKAMKTAFYIVVQANQSRAGVVRSIQAKRLTQNKPNTLESNEIAVRLTIDVSAEAFRAFEPEAVIKIPSDLIFFPTIEANAVSETEEQ